MCLRYRKSFTLIIETSFSLKKKQLEFTVVQWLRIWPHNKISKMLAAKL